MSMIHIRPLVARLCRECLTLCRRYRTDGWSVACVYGRACAINWRIFFRMRFGGQPCVECPCCGWHGFDFLALDSGRSLARHSLCPHCLAQPRHRVLHLYIHRCEPEFFLREGRVLHVAPEAQVRDLVTSNRRLQHIMTTYTNCPEQRFPGIAFRSDIQCLPLGNEAFDCLFALHTLEHVPDDHAGIREMYRVLKSGGIAYVMVPFEAGGNKTIEFDHPDLVHYGHVRAYAASDFATRLAVFDAEAIHPRAFLRPDELDRYGIPEDGELLFRCSKRPAPTSQGHVASEAAFGDPGLWFKSSDGTMRGAQQLEPVDTAEHAIERQCEWHD